MKWLAVLSRKKNEKEKKNDRKLTKEKTLGSDSLKIEKMKQDRVSELEKCENEKGNASACFQSDVQRLTLHLRHQDSILVCIALQWVSWHLQTVTILSQ